MRVEQVMYPAHASGGEAAPKLVGVPAWSGPVG